MRERATALVRQSAGEELPRAKKMVVHQQKTQKTQIDVAAGRDRGRFDVTQAKLVRGAPKEDNEMKCACIELVELLESMRLTDLRLPTSSILRLKYIWSLVAKWAAGFLLAPRTLLPASQHQ
jgi:hypothetical protein